MFYLSNRAKILDLLLQKVKSNLVKISRESEGVSVGTGWFDMEWPKGTFQHLQKYGFTLLVIIYIATFYEKNSQRTAWNS